MLRHTGKSRTLIHNLKLASLLSFVAGIINVTGLFAVNRLTTNVTGHFAYFADEMVKSNFALAVIYLLFILSFFLGAFCSNIIVEIMSRKNARFMNTIPVGLEIFILTAIAFLDNGIIASAHNTIACVLLFSMGMQNALVTSISNAVVRTTHLTGLFTDLGIELSQLIFYKKEEHQKKLYSSIKLRLTIICCFFFGGIVGGLGYFLYGIQVLLLAALTLTAALFYDTIKFKIVTLKRKYMS
jgi:uncharacterized membrane protein YoaK (UPF0700 family)